MRHLLLPPAVCFAVLVSAFCVHAASPGQDPRGPRPMLVDNIARPLRYTPDGGDFVVVNGEESFNRSLYGGSSGFRVDGGDRPEFSFYLPGRGGNLRLGIATAAGMKWLHECARIEARYRGGTMVYEIRDTVLGNEMLGLTVISPKADEGLLLRVETAARVELLTAFGGITGERGTRDGDIGCEKVPVREFFRLQPEYCQENEVLMDAGSLMVRAKAGSIAAVLPGGASIQTVDAAMWNDLPRLASSGSPKPTQPLAFARLPVTPGMVIGFQHLSAKEPAALWSHPDLSAWFTREQEELRKIAGRVTVETPDPFVNAAVPALAIAADAVWEDRKSVYLHGGVAWRRALLGWRVGYAGDALGWHERTRAHFDGYAARQNTTPPPAEIPAPEASGNLARNETALHSNGDMTKSHYDMNLVGIDVVFRHLLWTGDLDYARKIWPVVERHLAWERRLFRREFGPDKLPLYEAYCCIWASDDLSYNGGGVAHSSAYNLLHNRIAARVAKLLGLDPGPYEREAAALVLGMNRQLWLPDRGWFAEWKDLLGEQLVHPEAAAWTFYHTVDSEVPTPQQAWQMGRAVDTRLPHIPLRGPGVPEGFATISTTSWMPYVWSLNNVVLGETNHTALGLWQAGCEDSAFRLFKGALLDSMYLGLCPGNVGMCTWFDPNRRESQRDFGDGIGITSRALIEGLFGVTPDLLGGTLTIKPGFPAAWDHAKMNHPDFGFAFVRGGETERHVIESRFAKPVALRLIVPAHRTEVAAVTVNGAPATWQVVEDSVGSPKIRIESPPAPVLTVEIQWRGDTPASAPREIEVKSGGILVADLGAKIEEIADPQSALRDIRNSGATLHGTAVGTPGHRTLFARISQGQLSWWQPVTLDVREAASAEPKVFTTDWTKPVAAGETVPLESVFNDRVSEIFRHEYLTPRSPHCSLAMPKQGYGSWCHPGMTFEVDDSGLRAAVLKGGGRIMLPNGIPLATSGDATAPNIAFVSQWDNFPRQISVPLSGRASKIHLLMAGSTSAMQSRFDNGEVIVTYADGSTTRLALENPTTWWPIDQDYFIDDHAFARPGPLPLRVDLMTGKIRVLDADTFAGQGRTVAGGAATVLDLVLDPSRDLKSLAVRAIANEVVIGLMSATLQRP